MVGDGGGESDSVYETDVGDGNGEDEGLSFSSSILIGVTGGGGLILLLLEICDCRGGAELLGLSILLALSV